MANTEQLWRFLPIGYVLTVALEMPVLLLGLSRKYPLKHRIFAGFWINAVSYPIVVLTLPVLFDAATHRWLYTVVAETFAPAVECLLFAVLFHRKNEITWKQRTQDFATIIGANLFSFLFGDWLLHTAFGEFLLVRVFR